ncbi:hypothetical protein E2C01_085625 [Portunus trituberculatus]|uniref:Uncharacterized protein n=1 Tax=Portunus trituberculatus TaxID=210409 RepID=A0A5B7JCG4_PORTR|nr:hypothetical protein [Portunus trituberculatus]
MGWWNPTTYRFEAMPFLEWFKVTYMSPGYQGSRWLHRRCIWVVITINKTVSASNGWKLNSASHI